VATLANDYFIAGCQASEIETEPTGHNVSHLGLSHERATATRHFEPIRIAVASRSAGEHHRVSDPCVGRNSIESWLGDLSDNSQANQRCYGELWSAQETTEVCFHSVPELGSEHALQW